MEVEEKELKLGALLLCMLSKKITPFTNTLYRQFAVFLMCRTMLDNPPSLVMSSQHTSASKEWNDISAAGKEFNILISGRAGTGKSTLMSSLLGKEIHRRAAEDLGASSITVSTAQVNNVSIKTLFWNSPGIYDNGLNEAKKLTGFLDSIDLVIYAMRMDETRMRPEDTEIMQKLTRTFGASFWKKGMFVLTFANMVNYLDNHHTMRRSKEHSMKRAGQWEEYVRGVLSKEGISYSLLKGIPFVQAGHPTELQLFAEEKPWRNQLMASIHAIVTGSTQCLFCM
jgi:hypothetical protein